LEMNSVEGPLTSIFERAKNFLSEDLGDTQIRYDREMHYYFGITGETLQFLQTIAMDLGSVEHVEMWKKYCDTKDFALSLSNCWLCNTNGQWNLKKLTESNKDFVRFENLDGTEEDPKLLKEIKKILPKCTDESFVSNLCPLTIASMKVSRYYFIKKRDITLYIDEAKFANQNWYLIGTLSLKVGKLIDTNSLNDFLHSNIFQQLNVFYPVRSKIIEYISENNVDLYEQLQKIGKISKFPFITGSSNHFKNRPLMNIANYLYKEKLREVNKSLGSTKVTVYQSVKDYEHYQDKEIDNIYEVIENWNNYCMSIEGEEIKEPWEEEDETNFALNSFF